MRRLEETRDGSRFLAVVGPSGSGKSSVVRAGVLPAVRAGAMAGSEGWYVAEMFPGRHPMEELEAALLRVAARPVPHLLDQLEAGPRGLVDALGSVVPGDGEILLVIDQFEEAFTLTAEDQERALFLEALRVATADPTSRLRVIATLRADFYDRPLMYPRFGALLGERTEVVPPLTPDEVEQAITGPARSVGVDTEPGLAAELIADVAHQVGRAAAPPVRAHRAVRTAGGRSAHLGGLPPHRRGGRGALGAGRAALRGGGRRWTRRPRSRCSCGSSRSARAAPTPGGA